MLVSGILSVVLSGTAGGETGFSAAGCVGASEVSGFVSGVVELVTASVVVAEAGPDAELVFGTGAATTGLASGAATLFVTGLASTGGTTDAAGLAAAGAADFSEVAASAGATTGLVSTRGKAGACGLGAGCAGGAIGGIFSVTGKEAASGLAGCESVTSNFSFSADFGCAASGTGDGFSGLG